MGFRSLKSLPAEEKAGGCGKKKDDQRRDDNKESSDRFFHKNLHSAAFQLAAQIVMKVMYTFQFSCYNRLDYKGIPASVSDAPTRLLIDVQVRLSTQVGIFF